VGNQYDLVGRYFMDHIHADLGPVQAVDRKLLHDAFESFVVRGRLYSPKLVLADEQQAKANLLRILGEVIMEDPPDSPIILCKRLYKAMKDDAVPMQAKGKLAGSAMRAMFAEPLEITRTAWRLFMRGRGARATYSNVRLGVQCENAPCFESSVSLSDSRDCLGMRRTRLNWVVGELERATLKAFAKLFAMEIDRLGYAAYSAPVTAILNDARGWKGLIHDGAHQMGTARMAESPREGVVDPSCRLHGVDNLYIGSSAVFPTGGHSNPTLTIIALCIRIADTIKERLIGREKPTLTNV
jgi:choline dehydrogenase-like flavoprotein